VGEPTTTVEDDGSRCSRKRQPKPNQEETLVRRNPLETCVNPSASGWKVLARPDDAASERGSGFRVGSASSCV
jgi:hypothetical protein